RMIVGAIELLSTLKRARVMHGDLLARRGRLARADDQVFITQARRRRHDVVAAAQEEIGETGDTERADEDDGDKACAAFRAPACGLRRLRVETSAPLALPDLTLATLRQGFVSSVSCRLAMLVRAVNVA